ncbi:MAG: hypothetical protein P9F19_01385 [Candidatus Contendobacter sp.]|nr:hypothetical protein [Candidatus Contendobacter sp.]MDG4556042.1 hypothetical protein [Candidatus Contendobacter sp.]
MMVHWAWLLAAFTAGVLLLPGWSLTLLLVEMVRTRNLFHG